MGSTKPNHPYLDFISSMDDPTIPTKRLHKFSKPVKVNGRSYKGLNFFDAADLSIFESILRWDNTISGMRCATRISEGTCQTCHPARSHDT